MFYRETNLDRSCFVRATLDYAGSGYATNSFIHSSRRPVSSCWFDHGAAYHPCAGMFLDDVFGLYDR